MRRSFLASIGALAVALTAALIGPRAAVAEQTPAAVQYAALLGDARDALSASPPDLVRARGTLTALLDPTSEVTAGTSPGPALQPILNELDRNPPDVVGARQRLELLVAVLRLPDRSVAPLDPGYAPHLLRGVYASPAFRALDEHPDEGWLARIGRAVREALSGRRLPGGPLLDALAVVGLLGLAALVVYLLRRAGGAGAARVATPIEPPGTGSDPEVEWAAAMAAAAAGNHREAVRRAFRSALLAVARQGRLRVDPAWTTRELLARSGGDADLLAALAPAAAGFDRAWYSGDPVDRDQWLSGRAHCEAVRTLAGRAVRP